MTINITKKELRGVFSSLLLVIGFVYILVVLPNYIQYNSTPFGLLEEALPHTFLSAFLVWIGFSFHTVKRKSLRLVLVLLTAITTYIFLYNIIGIIWLNYL